mgnify:CR=1
MKKKEFDLLVKNQTGGTYGTVQVEFKPSLKNLTLATGESAVLPPTGESAFILLGATEIQSTANSFDTFALPRFLSVEDGKTYSFGIGEPSLGDDEIGDTFVLNVTVSTKANGKKIAKGEVLEQYPTEWETEEMVKPERKQRGSKVN